MQLSKVPHYPKMVYISHNGENLGEFAETQIQSMLSEGKIDIGAYFWKEGMEDWQPISELSFEDENKESIDTKSKIDKNAPTKTQIKFLQKRGLSVEGINKDQASRLVESTKEKEAEDEKAKLHEQEIINEKRRIESNKVNPQNLAFLDYHSVKYNKDITRIQASDLVDRTRSKYQDSKWNLVKHIIRPDLFSSVSSSSHLKSLEEDLKKAKAKYNTAKSNKNFSEDEVQEALEECENIEFDIESEKESKTESIEDWDNTFSSKEDFDLYDDKNLPLLLKAFKKPSKAQIKAVLNEFREIYKYPEELISFSQFFFVYKKLYPDSLKKGAKVKFHFSDITVPRTYQEAKALENGSGNPKKTKGCLSLIIIIPIILFIIFIAITR
jgi:hypothetical protein